MHLDLTRNPVDVINQRQEGCWAVTSGSTWESVCGEEARVSGDGGIHGRRAVPMLRPFDEKHSRGGRVDNLYKFFLWR